MRLPAGIRAAAMCLILAVGATLAQEPPRMRLEVKKEIPVAGLAAEPTFEPIRCDTRGNIYIRFHGSRPFASPVQKISPEGERKAVFSLEKVPGWEKGEFADFQVDDSGQVYLLAVRLGRNRTMEYGVVALDEEGRHQLTAELKMPFRLDSVDRLGVFRTGEFLLAGYRKLAEGEEPAAKNAPGAEKATVEPMAVIADRNGNLVREVSRGRGGGGAAAGRLLAAEAIHAASMVAWEDGHLYLMYRKSPPMLHVISAEGEEVRAVRVEPPSEKAVAMDLAVAPGFGIVVQFGEAEGEGRYPGEKMVFSIVDPQSGERLRDYQSSAKLGGALGCFDRGRFTFLGSVKGQLAVLQAAGGGE